MIFRKTEQDVTWSPSQDTVPSLEVLAALSVSQAENRLVEDVTPMVMMLTSSLLLAFVAWGTQPL